MSVKYQIEVCQLKNNFTSIFNIYPKNILYIKYIFDSIKMKYEIITFLLKTKVKNY